MMMTVQDGALTPIVMKFAAIRFEDIPLRNSNLLNFAFHGELIPDEAN